MSKFLTKVQRYLHDIKKLFDSAVFASHFISLGNKHSHSLTKSSAIKTFNVMSDKNIYQGD